MLTATMKRSLLVPTDVTCLSDPAILSRVASAMRRAPAEIKLMQMHHRRATEVVFEFELNSTEVAGARQRWIAKLFDTRRGEYIWRVNQQLWTAGLHAPSPSRIAQPLIYSREQRVFIQEKALGSTVWSILFTNTEPNRLQPAIQEIARWLANFRSVKLPGIRQRGIARTLARRCAELIAYKESLRSRVCLCARTIFRKLSSREARSLVLSHGDFHPKNIYSGADRSVTVIDLETVALCEREADIGYFLGQVAGMGLLQLGSLQATFAARDGFLRACEHLDPAFSRERTAVFLAIWFIENLHYQLCAMHNGNDDLANAWLDNAEISLKRAELLSFREPERPLRASFV